MFLGFLPPPPNSLLEVGDLTKKKKGGNVTSDYYNYYCFNVSLSLLSEFQETTELEDCDVFESDCGSNSNSVR